MEYKNFLNFGVLRFVNWTYHLLVTDRQMKQIAWGIL